MVGGSCSVCNLCPHKGGDEWYGRRRNSRNISTTPHRCPGSISTRIQFQCEGIKDISRFEEDSDHPRCVISCFFQNFVFTHGNSDLSEKNMFMPTGYSQHKKGTLSDLLK